MLPRAVRRKHISYLFGGHGGTFRHENATPHSEPVRRIRFFKMSRHAGTRCSLCRTKRARSSRPSVNQTPRPVFSTQVWFYGWGFYALGQDDTLEKQLTGEPTKTQTLPLAEIDIPSHGKSSFDALPQEANAGGAGSGGITGAQARATAEVDSVVVIDIDQCREEGSNTTEVLAAPNADESGGERDDANDWAGLKKRVWRIVLSPNIIAVAIGVVIAMIAPLQTLLFDNPRAVLRPVGAAIEV